ncbi:Biosynthetic peptidoglycan transglycosylase [Tepidimonas thermarum]|uniref:Biosynthetic peptidoglycan transglycosylase n=1 Tax=Tepidimonas thermarum TaxID=335431 RepID=A0A554X856_9BURK|nr:monofunctional biosynthetic peptidoglycan transglycosylase [Tepidimonas thermarum]TSE32013.1 Biosynthetic peptidoglycan transglycosylase [Tepidimonas thermarum]
MPSRARRPATTPPAAARPSRGWRGVLAWIGWTLAAALALQLFFVLRIALMAAVDPHSSAFQRSEAWRLLTAGTGLGQWRQRWVPYEAISPHLRRAVIAAEDAGFVDHFGVDWDAVRAARARNERQQAQRRGGDGHVRPARLVGGSTITQQLAKNLLLSGERTLWRKGQELLLTWALEALLDKRRILELYLNTVEWGEGVFGAEAAAQRYFGKPAARLNAAEAARLAVLLPAPKRYARALQSAYLSGRAHTILARMGAVRVP